MALMKSLQLGELFLLGIFSPLAVQGYAPLNYTFGIHNILVIKISSDRTHTFLGWETYN